MVNRSTHDPTRGRTSKYLLVGLLVIFGVLPSGVAADPTPEQITFFEKQIRPVLVNKCYSCHSAESKELKGGLRLDTREGVMQGGDSGQIVVPGNPEKSMLLQAISGKDKSLQMPPKEKLAETVVADFEQWIRMGVPDPRVDGPPLAPRKEIDIEQGRTFWSFQPLKKSNPPPVKDVKWVRSNIDKYLLNRLEDKGLKPTSDADPYTLLRRVTLDITGLPPTPDEIESFLKTRSLESVLDRLLASKAFGERWGRYWLDVARYAETSGRQVNFNYPLAWRYRNYVVDAFNTDRPFDQFVREQIAGDLLPYANESQKAQQQIATGFLAIGPKPLSEQNKLQFQMDIVDEQIDAISQAFLGLSVACARCHDHKFDPIPQKDYYALAGILRSSETCYGTIRVIQSFHSSKLLEFNEESGVSDGMEALKPEELETLAKQIKEIRDRREEQARNNQPMTGADFNTLAISEWRLSSFDKNGRPRRLAMGVRELGEVVDSPLYIRGEVEKPGPIIKRGLLQVLSTKSVDFPQDQSGRLELAQWLASCDNPLTARVFVNRVWRQLFGRGLVATPDNFGASGQAPSHPELLDHLAFTFIEDGWSVKKLIRRIMLSHAYLLSSQAITENLTADPDNILVWRMSPRRWEAEVLRDSMLSVSGQLILTPPLSSPIYGKGEGPSTVLMRLLPHLDGKDFHRAVYLPIIRDSVLESLALFDFADPNQVSGDRATTNVPAQALYLLNSPFVQGRAEEAAARILAEKEGSNADRLRNIYLEVFGRPPTATELTASEQFLREYPARLAADGVPTNQQLKATWAAFFQALFASADFLYRN